MRTVLICHEEDALNREGLARWLGSFSELSGLVVLREGRNQTWRRVRRELKRSGWAGFLDVLAFRVYYRALLAARDRRWERDRLARLREEYPELRPGIPTLVTSSPNTEQVARFIERAAPDIMIARCKTLLDERIFSLPSKGTFVMHPGICPEYRNAHGCFWALVRRDLARVGMTVLRIDKGVDTGPVYAYYHCGFDEAADSHVVIQHRTVFDNLAAIREKLEEIDHGSARPLDTTGRESAVWGQPRLTSYLRWKFQARRRRRVDACGRSSLSRHRGSGSA
jgi:Formyl transferase